MSYPTPWQPWQGQRDLSMLASHADRERAVDVLKAGFTEGRMPQDELERRVARAYASRTVGELARLVADLPQGPVPVSPAVPLAYRPLPAPPPSTNGMAVASLICGVATTMTAGVTGLPALILGHMARAEIRRTGQSGDGLAVGGLVMGWLSVAGWGLFLFLMVVLGAG